MERSRSDVYQRTIDEQNQKIEKYQTKLRGYWLPIYFNKKSELMLKLCAAAVCNHCKVYMPISIVVRRCRVSCGPRSRLWDLPLTHLSPSLKVIHCEYVGDPYITKNKN